MKLKSVVGASFKPSIIQSSSWVVFTAALLLLSNLGLPTFSYAEEAAPVEAVWIDVRTLVEHKIDNIPGDLRIPHDEILQAVTQKIVDKRTPIKLYCRSGGRAGKAASVLEQAGYVAVENVGGIDDARKQRNIKP